MVDLAGVEDFEGLLIRLAQGEIQSYYETLRKIANDSGSSEQSKIAATREMHKILKEYCKSSDVSIPKFIEVGAKKYKMMELAHQATMRAARRIAGGESIEDIVDLGLGFADNDEEEP